MASKSEGTDPDVIVKEEAVEKTQDETKLLNSSQTADSAENQVAVFGNVRSKAVLKFDSLEIPTKFTELQRNFNLNRPPHNWLHSRSKWENYLRDVSLGKDRSGSFTSFSLAHEHPEVTGDIDVISDSENIKRLLKIPYSKSHVSMMVHRVGDSLLVDDFDIHKHLLRKQEDDWQWLRKFYFETIVQQMTHDMKDKSVMKKNKSRDYLQNRNLFSKFLHYSLAGNEEGSGDNSVSNQRSGVEHRCNDSSLPQEFHHQRQVEWTFEDIRMLIGTDLPIFGGGTHPCVSLRLRDMRKPINVLTGLDYWLDNLMCNVPEMAMCYHLNGIVQSYEIMKTEDIPEMENSQFSTTVVKDVAQNILSFLKANATKEGHTYWLYKGHNEEIVKLYDLTTLCADFMEDRNANPFTVPVGILLYRVARNMRQTLGRKKSATIRTLLENSLKLLDNTLYSQVVTSAHYLLSDLYISDDIHNQEVLCGNSDDSDYDDESGTSTPDESSEGRPDSQVDINALCAHIDRSSDMLVARYPPITGSVEERCKEALTHISMGLQCLDRNVTLPTPPQNLQPDIEEQQQFCNPDEAIPLHYEPLRPARRLTPDRQNDASSTSDQDMPLITRENNPARTWHTLSKTLLLRKSAVAYYGLAEASQKEQRIGEALKYIMLALKCFCAMKQLTPNKADETQDVLCATLQLCGDAHVMLAHSLQHFQEYCRQFEIMTEADENIIESAEMDLKEFCYDWVQKISNSGPTNLKRSITAYGSAITVAKKARLDTEIVKALTRRFGNSENELGVQHMNQSTTAINEQGCRGNPGSDIRELWKLSMKCFDAGVEAFDTIEDVINMALVHSNRGRLMRLCAQAYAKYDDTGQRLPFSTEEKQYYHKASESYQSALRLLGKRGNCAEIWDSISWELSSTYFNMATLMQDFAPLALLAQEQVEKDVCDLMIKSLKYCDTETDNARLPTCQYRAAIIHHRLASLYHNSYRNQLTEQKKRHLRTLAEMHYSKAVKFFTLIDSSVEILRAQLERVALAEFQINGQTSATSKLKTLQGALDHLLESSTALNNLEEQLTSKDDVADAASVEAVENEARDLLGIFESRLQFVLLNMVKVTSPTAKKGKGTAEPSLQQQVFKTMYAEILKVTQRSKVKSSESNSEEKNSVLTVCRSLRDLLISVGKLLKGVKPS